jgi:L-seryl-tRNA(Ser) seleniumtransferase
LQRHDVNVFLRRLPQVHRLLETAQAQHLAEEHGRRAVASVLRALLQELRATQEMPEMPSEASLLARAGEILAGSAPPRLVPVINATGIILHTNLGRAPLAAAALAAVAAVAAGYSNLELDLCEGQRGSRLQSVLPLLCELTGAESGVAVNNAAAALLLALSGLAAGGEVLVSRGELVEIGGGFRIPDVIQQGGARLVEVGSTNKTRLADYAAAITPETRLILKVHRSNFRILGFTEEVEVAALAELAHARNLRLVHDLGSGALLDLARFGHGGEPRVQDCLSQGADLVIFSGDKLLGGPQAGIVLGREPAVAPLRKHPLMRALRLDKMSLAALEATLRLYRDPEQAAAQIPILRMMRQSVAEIRARAKRLQAALPDTVSAEIIASSGHLGGGSMPGQEIASVALCISSAQRSPEKLALRLRRQRPAVLPRLSEGRLLLDLLTVSDDEVPQLAAAITAAARAS